MSAPRPSLQLDSARQARDRGWRPFPCDHPELEVCAGIPAGHHCEPKDRGKHPCVAFGTFCATEPGDKMLDHYWGAEPRNVGIACGPSGLVVVDEDECDALERFAHGQREKLPKTYRVATSRGWHYYFEAPDDLVIGNSPGLLGPHGMDVRGGKGGGGYVIAAGSVHHTGHVYVAEDPFVVPVKLMPWLAAAILTKAPALVGPPAAPGQAGGSAAGMAFNGGWTDYPRYGTTEQLLAQYARHVGEVLHRGDAFRHELFVAARDGWRLVDLGVIAAEAMFADLRGRVAAVWGAEPDERDRQIVMVEARARASESPWVVIAAQEPVDLHSRESSITDRSAANGQVPDSSAPDGSSPNGQTSNVPTAEHLYRLKLTAEVEKERLRREARRQLAEEEDDDQLVADAARQLRVRDAARARVASEGQPPIATQPTEAFLDPAPVDYLMEGMFHA